MKQMRKTLCRFFAGLLCLCMILAGITPAAVALTDETVYIRSDSDWQQLIQNCRLDTWSQGKTVVLECDLTITENSSIPTFGGVFDGAGHTIHGLFLTGEGSNRGVFRYVQEGAKIKNLNVSGSVDVSGSWSGIGGIAGVNRGTIANCSFSGTIDAPGSVGGIAGINEATGEIINCTVSGSLSGEHYTGGIAGENYGSMIQCVNRARVNTDVEGVTPDLDSVKLSDLRSTETVTACTDTGGITGFSKGVIQSCTNYGAVGYPHTGYNVGGIVGRQSGYVDGCTNHGLVQGRKEVGGIAGQMEPYSQLLFEESTLQKLADELSALQAVMEDTLRDVDDSRQDISGHLTTIGTWTDAAKENAEGMADELQDLGNGAADTVNDLSARVARVLDRSVTVVDDLERASDDLEDAIRDVEEGFELLEDAAGPASEAAGKVKNLLATLKQAADRRKAALLAIQNALSALNGIWDMDEEEKVQFVQSAWEDLNQGITSARQSAKEVCAAVQALREMAPLLQQAAGSAQDAAAPFRDGLDAVGDATGHLTDALDELGDLLAEQAEQPALELPKLDSSFHEKEDGLSTALDAISAEFRAMQESADDAGDVLSANLERIGARFDAVIALLQDDDSDSEDRIQDISGERSDLTWGTVSNCTNHAAVEGDINTGGIAGSMAVEFSFDPEDDLVKQGDVSVNVRYLAHAVLSDNLNQGVVTGRKNCVGGIAGRADLGIIRDCQNYGSAESTNGSYVGGIAGRSDAAIQDCWAKCTLTGSARVGGIAGFAADVSGCGTLVQLTDTGAYMGAIAGEGDGTFSENYFVSETLGGIDGISYSGQAEPLPYEVFLELGAPTEFSVFTLTFTDGDSILYQLDVSYGQRISEDTLPTVPEKEGFYGAWEPFDHAFVAFDQTIQAVYTPWLTTLSSGDGTILAEGTFLQGTELQVELTRNDLPADMGTLIGQWKISADGEPFTAIRVLALEKTRNLHLWYSSETGSWEELSFTKEGSFLRAEISENDVTLCLTQQSNSIRYALIAASVCGTGVLLIWYHRKRKHHIPVGVA